ncbi:hypothetical protein GCM10010182_45600 [Actinomadura cremea]|nr:hypothetical protein GCM10010182_45600 [Actinomadura cremea]
MAGLIERMLIDGEPVPAADGRTFDNVDPATDEVIGAVPDAGAADMERAVRAARRAFDGTDWSTNTCLVQLRDALRENVETLGAGQERAVALARRFRTGTVSVNGAQWFDVGSPFGGYKQSGLGREWGTEGLEDFLEVKTISFPAAR